METIQIKAQNPYNVYVGENISEFASGEAARLSEGRKLLLLSDKKVYSLYGRELHRIFTQAGFKCYDMPVIPGETSKTPRRLFDVWGYLCECGFSRQDAVLSLGGGVVSDVGGFAAATYMRGINHFIMPTTLLAMCDASVGGKTGINLPHGKNLAGAFYSPKAVFCSTDFLDSLSPDIYSDGMAEVIKYGLIGSPEFLDLLAQGTDTGTVVKKSVEIKNYYIGEDERDLGLRQFLNFGHTLAHGAEKLSHGKISHGKAVAAGMYITTLAAVKNGLCSEDVIKIEDELFEKYSLPKTLPFPIEKLCEVALSDKKRTDDSIYIVVPSAKGKAERIKLPLNRLIEFFSGAYEN